MTKVAGNMQRSDLKVLGLIVAIEPWELIYRVGAKCLCPPKSGRKNSQAAAMSNGGKNHSAGTCPHSSDGSDALDTPRTMFIRTFLFFPFSSFFLSFLFLFPFLFFRLLSSVRRHHGLIFLARFAFQVRFCSGWAADQFRSGGSDAASLGDKQSTQVVSCGG